MIGDQADQADPFTAEKGDHFLQPFFVWTPGMSVGSRRSACWSSPNRSSGTQTSEAVQVVLLQEIMSEPGVQFLEDHGWMSRLERHGNCIQEPGSKAYQHHAASRGHRYHAHTSQSRPGYPVFGGPHSTPCHHCADRAWQGSLDHSQGGGLTLAGGRLSSTALHHSSLLTPHKGLPIPTYHPYNTSMESRRLDYLTSKHIAPPGGQQQAAQARGVGWQHVLTDDASWKDSCPPISGKSLPKRQRHVPADDSNQGGPHPTVQTPPLIPSPRKTCTSPRAVETEQGHRTRRHHSRTALAAPSGSHLDHTNPAQANDFLYKGELPRPPYNRE